MKIIFGFPGEVLVSVVFDLLGLLLIAEKKDEKHIDYFMLHVGNSNYCMG